MDPLAALDVDAAGELLGRSASTVRDYCRRELLPGSYRQRGREWRIPPDAIRAFHAREAREAGKANGAGKRQDDDTNLSAWRDELLA